MSQKNKQENTKNGWSSIKLRDIGSATIGLTYSPADVVEVGGIPVLRSSNIQNGIVDYADLVRVTTPIPEKLRTREGDILICARNGSRNLIGKSAYLTSVDAGKTFGAFMSIFRTKHHRYVYQLFQSQAFKREIARDLGPTINQVTTGNLHKFKFDFPPEDEEGRIVKVLETWDRAIELTEREIMLKREVKKGLMQRLLTGKVRLPGFSGEWEVAKLRDIYAERKQKCKETPGLKLYSLTIEDGVCPKSERYDRSFLVKGEKEYKRTQEYDLVYNPANLRFGAIAQNKNVEPVLLSPIYQVLYVKDTKKYNADFLGHLLTWERQVRKMSTYAEGTLIERMEVKIESFKQIVVDVPKKEEQDKIASVFNDAGIEIKLLEEKLTLLKDQKKYLLNNLVTGAIRTPENI